MRRVCLTLPTNRACAATVTAVAEEAAYAAGQFGTEVHLLLLDSAAPGDVAGHARALAERSPAPGVVPHHLDEAAQRAFLRRVIHRADLPKPELLLDLMLPSAVSYGACTNRAFLAAAALGCASVHRRDSDSRYQSADGEPVFPVHHELRSLGLRAADAAALVDAAVLDPACAERPVAMVAGSFVGELSVDLGEMLERDPSVYQEVVGLWAPPEWPAEQKRQLAAESFRGAGSAAFSRDHAVLTVVDPMRVDMCNISFHGVHEQVPLPPATDTIGSDYFLIHLVHDARLPGVLHNRHIVNFHTGERKTDAGFAAYQLRFVKFLLSMRYFHHLYRRMAETGEALLDGHGRVRPDLVAAFARESTRLDRAENVQRLETVDRAYRKLGGRYADVADLLLARRARLLDEAQQDIADFALLTEAWPALVAASRELGPQGLGHGD